ncbi:MAG: hypothetical protein KGH69_01055 [Candidatus Micrarchaeota archaeon]|nr:hypothetical protein [Candidatus Micrarchaeota archaeon]
MSYYQQVATKLTPNQAFMIANRLTVRLQGEFTDPRVKTELALRLRDAIWPLKEVSERHQELKGVARLDAVVEGILEEHPDAVRNKGVQKLTRDPDETKALYDAAILAKRTERLLLYYDNF